MMVTHTAYNGTFHRGGVISEKDSSTVRRETSTSFRLKDSVGCKFFFSENPAKLGARKCFSIYG